MNVQIKVDKTNGIVSFGGSKYMALSYVPQLQAMARGIARKVDKDLENNFIIVSIGQGGNDITGLLTNYFRAVRESDPPVFYVVIKSYQDIGGPTTEPRLLQTISEGARKVIKGKDVLVVDDIADTGRTFKTAVDYLNGKDFEEMKPKSIKTAAAITKKNSVFKPYYTSGMEVENNVWVVFPRERDESAAIILKRHDIEGGTNVLRRLGYPFEEAHGLCTSLKEAGGKWRDLDLKIVSEVYSEMQI